LRRKRRLRSFLASQPHSKGSRRIRTRKWLCCPARRRSLHSGREKQQLGKRRMSRLRRLDQLLASLGHGSRREVRALINGGRVAVSGAVARKHDLKVDAAAVLVNGEPL